MLSKNSLLTDQSKVPLASLPYIGSSLGKTHRGGWAARSISFRRTAWSAISSIWSREVSAMNRSASSRYF